MRDIYDLSLQLGHKIQRELAATSEYIKVSLFKTPLSNLKNDAADHVASKNFAANDGLYPNNNNGSAKIMAEYPDDAPRPALSARPQRSGSMRKHSLSPKEIDKNQNLLKTYNQELPKYFSKYAEKQNTKKQKPDYLKLASALVDLDKERAKHQKKSYWLRSWQHIVGDKETRVKKDEIATKIMQSVTHEQIDFKEYRDSIKKGAKHLFLSNTPGAVGRRAALFAGALTSALQGSMEILTCSVVFSMFFAYAQRLTYAHMHSRDFPKSDIASRLGGLNMTNVYTPSTHHLDSANASDEQKNIALAYLLSKNPKDLNSADTSHMRAADDVYSIHKKFKIAQKNLYKLKKTIPAKTPFENLSREQQLIVHAFNDLKDHLKKTQYRYQAECSSLKTAFRVIYAASSIRLAFGVTNGIIYGLAGPSAGVSLIVAPILASLGGVVSFIEMIVLYKQFSVDYGGMAKVNLLNCVKTNDIVKKGFKRDDIKNAYQNYQDDLAALNAADNNHDSAEIKLKKQDALKQKFETRMEEIVRVDGLHSLWTHNEDYRMGKALDYIAYRGARYAGKIEDCKEQIAELQKKAQKNGGAAVYSEIFELQQRLADLQTKRKAWDAELESLKNFKENGDNGKSVEEFLKNGGFKQKETLEILLGRPEAASLLSQCIRATQGKAFQRHLEIFFSTLPNLTIMAGLDCAQFATHANPAEKVGFTSAHIVNTFWYQRTIAGGFAGEYHANDPKQKNSIFNNVVLIGTTIGLGVYRPFEHLAVSRTLNNSKKLRAEADAVAY